MIQFGENDLRLQRELGHVLSRTSVEAVPVSDVLSREGPRTVGHMNIDKAWLDFLWAACHSSTRLSITTESQMKEHFRDGDKYFDCVYWPRWAVMGRRWRDQTDEGNEAVEEVSEEICLIDSLGWF